MSDQQRSRGVAWFLGPAAAMLLMLSLAGVGVLVGWVIGHYTASSSSASSSSSGGSSANVAPAVAAGAHTFVQFACSACHGEQGKGGVSPYVPSLATAGQTLTAAQMRSIIDHGLGVVNDPKRPYMPVWGAVISTTQVNDLVAYIKAGLPAVPDAVPPPVPSGQGAAVAGAALYLVYGCVNCHGPNGLGGVPNPGSADKTIPPLAGQDFRGQFNTDQKIKDVIESGSVIGAAPIASMPHWAGIITPEQLDQLVAYIKTLK